MESGDKLKLYEEHDGIREYMFKILVIGDIATGKTSLVKRMKFGTFSESVKPTVGVDFLMKEIKWDSKTIIRLQLWDIAGQERYRNLTRVYYQDAVGAFVVFDLTRRGTFENTEKWKLEIDDKVKLAHDSAAIPMVLLANKCDLEKSVGPEELDKWCDDHDFVGWEETSAKEGTNIDKAISFIIYQILDRIQGDEDTIMDSQPKGNLVATEPAAGAKCCG